MKISIITPVYNDQRVTRAVDSVLGQVHSVDLETIVVDGGSTGPGLDALEMVRGRVTRLVSEKDRGIYDAMNKGIGLASGDVIGILNADDRYADTGILESVARTFSDPATDACYGDLIYVDDGDRIVRYWKSGEYRPSKFYFGWMPPHPTFFVRRSVYARHGIFRLDYPIAADYELMLRFVLRQKVKVKYISRVMVRMALGGTSNRSTANIVRANVEVYRAWRDNRLSFGFLVPFLKPVQKPLQYLRRPVLGSPSVHD